MANTNTPIICTIARTRKIQSSVSKAEENHENSAQAQQMAKLAKPKPSNAAT
jgi:hypothetical protein